MFWQKFDEIVSSITCCDLVIIHVEASDSQVGEVLKEWVTQTLNKNSITLVF